MNGTLEIVDGRRALRFERRLAHPVERVWRAVTEPAELERWFVAPVPWTPTLHETIDAAGQTGEITALEPPTVIAWSWGEERYRFELHPDGDGCRLVFVHVFDDRLGPAAQHAAGWEAYLSRLSAHLAGGFLAEEVAHQPIGELHERYARKFGEDPERGRRTIAAMGFRGLTLEDGPALRLERRYRHPIERVWRALTDRDELSRWFPADEPLVVSHSEPPRVLAGTWYGEPLRFELRPDGEGCILVFTHSFADRPTSARTAAGWDRVFARLDADLAGVEMGERESLAIWPDVHERYAETFGVDPAIGREAFAEHSPK
jgi:uncharacterized protein YndB with AHSA1/START domain